MATVRARRSLHIMVVAGEASGDALGAGLMAALKSLTAGAVRFTGVGGPAMEAQGLASLFPMQELSLMGIAEVLPKVRHLARRLRETEDHALGSGPDAVVTIDSPGFNFRLARRLKPQGLTLIHYVAPSVWAWRPGRAKRIVPLFDHLLSLLPFEPRYFEDEGLRSSFVGHPVIESAAGKGDGFAFRARHKLPAGATVVCVLPGSRHSETRRLLQPFGATIERLAQEFERLVAVVPAVPHLEASIRAATAVWRVPTVVVPGAERYDAMAASDAALAASGTVALELALAKVPAVIAYRMHPLTWLLVKRLALTPYVNLVNILVRRAVVPELLQHDCVPARLDEAVRTVLTDKEHRAAQMEAAADAIGMLTPPNGTPSQAAAEAVLKVIDGKVPPSTAAV
ncbi:MAG: lipid-A-disaccharide synthase [Alphaproteobacteria bacterium]|nr:lipid-A-disaccharide synthase [Alphaproteobacteria bacterium]